MGFNLNVCVNQVADADDDDDADQPEVRNAQVATKKKPYFFTNDDPVS